VHGLLSAGTVATKPGWLLETHTTVATTTATVVVVASAIASITAIVEHVLLVQGHRCWVGAVGRQPCRIAGCLLIGLA
jgi:hypothetical protein